MVRGSKAIDLVGWSAGNSRTTGSWAPDFRSLLPWNHPARLTLTEGRVPDLGAALAVPPVIGSPLASGTSLGTSRVGCIRLPSLFIRHTFQ